GRARADGHGKVRTDRAVLIRAVDHLSGTIATQPASGEVSDGPTAPADHGLLRIDVSLVQEIVYLFGDHHGVKMIGVLAVFDAQFILIENLFLVLLPRRRQFIDPGIPLSA